jgi:hypothetical protein
MMFRTSVSIVQGGYVEEVEGRRKSMRAVLGGFIPLTHRDWIGPAGAVFSSRDPPAWFAAATDVMPADPDFEPRLLDEDLSCLAAQHRLHVEEMLGPSRWTAPCRSSSDVSGGPAPRRAGQRWLASASNFSAGIHG